MVVSKVRSCIGNWIIENVMTVIYAAWVGFWFSVGHLLSLPIYSSTKGWSESAFFEPIGLVMAWCASMVYFRIAMYVVEVVYNKKLPGGEDFGKEFSKIMAQSQKQQKRGK